MTVTTTYNAIFSIAPYSEKITITLLSFGKAKNARLDPRLSSTRYQMQCTSHIYMIIIIFRKHNLNKYFQAVGLPESF